MLNIEYRISNIEYPISNNEYPISNNQSEQLIATCKEVLLREEGLRVASVYGSTVSGKRRANSDVDVAVLFDVPLSAEHKMALTVRLGDALSKTIDLVDLFSLSGTILKQILCEGRVVVKKRSEDLAQLLQRMIYNQADMMPYVRRTLLERQERFIHGS